MSLLPPSPNRHSFCKSSLGAAKMVSFYQIFVLLFCAFFVAASPMEVSPRNDLYRRQTDWGNYVYIASITTGIIGQNLALIASPGVGLSPSPSGRIVC